MVLSFTQQNKHCHWLILDLEEMYLNVKHMRGVNCFSLLNLAQVLYLTSTTAATRLSSQNMITSPFLKLFGDYFNSFN